MENLMNSIETAVNTFSEGFSCSQAVLSAFCEPLGLERERALKIAQAFGGGIAESGDICGAVSGAYMVIGLKYGRTRADDDAAKEKTYSLVKEFQRRFTALYDSIICRDLLGYKLNIPQEREKALEKGLFENFCPKLVRSAAEILTEIL
jgi:C_GCAxxG_C_C family probable redox protein